jgi:N-acetylmuramoyl-L-alanine amidase
MAIVVVDPGHGGTAKVGGSSPNNAIGPTGLLEKTVTLDVGKRLKARLEAKGVQAILTRSTDVNLGLADRAKVARNASADVFLCLHFNGFNKIAQGTETFHHRAASADSQALAKRVQAKLVDATDLKDRGIKTAGFEVLAPANHAAKTAACLVEISFMDVPAEEARLKTAVYLDALAEALAQAAISWMVSDGRIPAPAGGGFGMAGAQEPEDGFEARADGI